MTGVEQWLLPKVGVMNPPWTLHHTRRELFALMRHGVDDAERGASAMLAAMEQVA